MRRPAVAAVADAPASVAAVAVPAAVAAPAPKAGLVVNALPRTKVFADGVKDLAIALDGDSQFLDRLIDIGRYACAHQCMPQQHAQRHQIRGLAC